MDLISKQSFGVYIASAKCTFTGYAPRLVTSRVQLVVCRDVLSSGGGGGVEWEIVVGMCQFLSLYSGPDHLSLISKFLHMRTPF